MSALLFCPGLSRVKSLFRHLQPSWVEVDSSLVEKDWSPCLQTLEIHLDWPSNVIFSPDGYRLASITSSIYRQFPELVIWDTETGILLQTLRAENHITKVKFSPDGRWLAFASTNKLLLWNSKTDVPQHTFIMPKNVQFSLSETHDIAFSSNGLQLVSITSGYVLIWDVESGKCQRTFNFRSHIKYPITISSDGSKLASSLGEEGILIFSIQTDALQYEFTINDGISLALSHDGRHLATGLSVENIQIWDTETKVLLYTLESMRDPMAFSHDGRWLASSDSNSVQIWDMESGQKRQRFGGHTREINSLSFSQDSRRLASSSRDGTVRIWDMEMDMAQQTSTSEYQAIWANIIAFSHDGHFLVSDSADSADNKLMLWNVEANTLQHTFTGYTERVKSIIFSSDGLLLASCAGHKMLVWNVITGKLEHILVSPHEYRLLSLAFSSDGLWLASVSFREAAIWDLKTSKLQRIVANPKIMTKALYDELPYSFTSVALSSDGRLLATGSNYAETQVWDSRTGSMLQNFKGGYLTVKVISFSSDGRLLVIATEVEEVSIWDVESGLRQWKLFVGVVPNKLSFGPLDKSLVTNFGSIVFDIDSSHEPSEPTWSGFCLKPNASWITLGGRNLLWLPSEYRSYAVATNGSTIAIGLSSGKVLFIKFFSQDCLI
jgi:WD40 repeat protein